MRSVTEIISSAATTLVRVAVSADKWLAAAADAALTPTDERNPRRERPLECFWSLSFGPSLFRVMRTSSHNRVNAYLEKLGTSSLEGGQRAKDKVYNSALQLRLRPGSGGRQVAGMDIQ